MRIDLLWWYGRARRPATNSMADIAMMMGGGSAMRPSIAQTQRRKLVFAHRLACPAGIPAERSHRRPMLEQNVTGDVPAGLRIATL